MIDSVSNMISIQGMPRFSTTVILVRPRGKSTTFELLLVKRVRTLRVLPGFMVFPGGVIEDGDLFASQVWLHQKPGIHVNNKPLRDSVPFEFELESANVLGQHVSRTELYWSLFATGVRELHEETGILMFADLADDNGQMRKANATELWRQTVGSTSSLPVARYFGRRVTPPEVKYRFDAHYFVCLAPDRLQIQLNAQEIESAQWVTPHEILKQYESGAFLMAPPTVDAVLTLANHATIDELFEKGFMPAQVYDEQRVRDFISRL